MKVLKLYLLVCLFMVSCFSVEKDKTGKLQLKSNEEFRESLQYSLLHYFDVNIDSLSKIGIIDTLKGEKYQIDKQFHNKYLNDYKLWSEFYSNKEFLSNWKLRVRQKEDKLFFLNYFLEISNKQNKTSHSFNIDSLDCYFAYYRHNRNRPKVVKWFIVDKESSNYFYGECSGGYIKFPKGGIEVYPLEGFEHFETPLNYLTEFRGKKKIIPYVGEYTYLKFKSKHEVELKYKHKYDRMVLQDTIKKIISWLSVVDKDYFIPDYFKDADFSTCYFNYTLQKHYPTSKESTINIQWLTYDKKSKYYYYGGCSGIEGKYKYIYNPLEGFEAKSEGKEEKRKMRKR